MPEVENPSPPPMPDEVTVLAATMITPEPSASGPVPVAPAPLTTIQLAVYAGWTMAVLYGNLQDQPAEIPELRTVNELQPPQRRELELARLRHLLQQLSCAPGIAPGRPDGEYSRRRRRP